MRGQTLGVAREERKKGAEEEGTSLQLWFETEVGSSVLAQE